MKVPRFPNVPRASSFQAELKKRVEAYFEEKNISMTGNWKLYLKTAILGVTFFALYVVLVFFTPPVWLAITLCVVFGVNIAAIGFNIMHDAAHGSYSGSRTLNSFAASSLDFLGASSFMWKVKHNLIHHTYTNIDGYDDDIDVKPWMRMTLTQKKHFFHRFQHIYAILLYAFLYVLWIGVMDFQKYFKGKVGELPIKQMVLKDHLLFWASKLSFATLFIFLPIYSVGFMSYIIGFVIFSATTGIVISLVFQLAHAVEELEFPTPDASDKVMMENEWAIHQVKTTANFATKNKLITWYMGGLNYQIEHHLFPKISHVHYPAISQIVKKTSEEFGLKYQEFPKMRHAVLAHLQLLKRMGTAA